MPRACSSSEKLFQRVMRRAAVNMVEQATGRKVIAFTSDNHVDPDVSVEVFLLEPREEPVQLDEAEAEIGSS